MREAVGVIKLANIRLQRTAVRVAAEPGRWASTATTAPSYLQPKKNVSPVNAPTSTALQAFQALCHEYYTCYVFASQGMENLAKSFPLSPAEYPNQRIFIGNTAPGEGPTQSAMSAAQAVASAQRDGEFPDTIGKALLIRIYAEWDERYRHEMAKEFYVVAKAVRCNLMGDLRRVRHWIVHNKSVVEPDVFRLVVLRWKLTPGDAFRITSAMFREFANCINTMQVQIDD